LMDCKIGMMFPKPILSPVHFLEFLESFLQKRF
jgi:hypothetical protein